jgi:hypothetical protein
MTQGQQTLADVMDAWQLTIETDPRSQLARVLGIECVQLLCGSAVSLMWQFLSLIL